MQFQPEPLTFAQLVTLTALGAGLLVMGLLFARASIRRRIERARFPHVALWWGGVALLTVSFWAFLRFGTPLDNRHTPLTYELVEFVARIGLIAVFTSLMSALVATVIWLGARWRAS